MDQAEGVAGQFPARIPGERRVPTPLSARHSGVPAGLRLKTFSAR
jgi:hypothetical protein